ncbi:unnamed protein product [Amoebophrya sp. A120]|nr:unnamed protein product [Amoebophrya sp. A120]|eukprot:GSA120T00010220001.1
MAPSVFTKLAAAGVVAGSSVLYFSSLLNLTTSSVILVSAVRVLASSSAGPRGRSTSPAHGRSLSPRQSTSSARRSTSSARRRSSPARRSTSSARRRSSSARDVQAEGERPGATLGTTSSSSSRAPPSSSSGTESAAVDRPAVEGVPEGDQSTPETFECAICLQECERRTGGEALCPNGHRVHQNFCAECDQRWTTACDQGWANARPNRSPTCPLCRGERPLQNGANEPRSAPTRISYLQNGPTTNNGLLRLNGLFDAEGGFHDELNKVLKIAIMRVLFKLRYAARKEWLAAGREETRVGVETRVPVLSGTISDHARKYGENYADIWRKIDHDIVSPEREGNRNEWSGHFHRRRNGHFFAEDRSRLWFLVSDECRVVEALDLLFKGETSRNRVGPAFSLESSKHFGRRGSVQQPQVGESWMHFDSNGAFASHLPHTEAALSVLSQEWRRRIGEEEQVRQVLEASQPHTDWSRKILDAIVEWQWATHTKFCLALIRKNHTIDLARWMHDCLRTTQVKTVAGQHASSREPLAPLVGNTSLNSTIGGAETLFRNKPLPFPLNEDPNDFSELEEWMRILLGSPGFGEMNEDTKRAYIEMGKLHTKALVRDHVLGEFRLMGHSPPTCASEAWRRCADVARSDPAHTHGMDSGMELRVGSFSTHYGRIRGVLGSSGG